MIDDGTPQGDGDCFVVAGHLIVARGDPWLLCHGWPIWRGGDGTQRMAHAWIELDGIVVDKSNGHDVSLPAFLYYRVGEIDPADVRRYTFDEAVALMLSTGNYGPWDPVEGS